jgi:hypothetical protein
MDVTCEKKEHGGLPREIRSVGGWDGDQGL